MVIEGRQAPDFTLPDQDGNAVSLHGLRGKWVVVYFYPASRHARVAPRRPVAFATAQPTTPRPAPRSSAFPPTPSRR